MSKKNVAGVVLLIFGVLFFAGCAGVQKDGRYSRHGSKKVSSTKLPKFDVPIVVNDRVVVWIDYFQGPGRRHFEKYLTRSGRYIPAMQRILKEYGLPQDLVYLAMIESGFSHRAYSRAKAAGHWQFISATGRRYGLDLNGWVDERRDWKDSTRAAAQYLKDLYGIFGDWYLAMAAYNAGEGKILKAIRINNTRDFWQMIERDRRYLRTETKDYVPKFIAAAIIAKSPEKFGFDNVIYDRELEYETARVNTQTDIQVIARCAGVDAQVIEELNPELLKGATPPSTRDYEVRLPKGTAVAFNESYSRVPESEKLMMVRHTVRRGDSLGRIAKKYGISVREIMAANDVRSSKQLKKGAVLIIPRGGEAKRIIDTEVALETSHPTGRVIKHRIQRGETLGLIAQNYGVGISDLKRWNRLKGDHIRVGRYLRVYGVDEGPATVASKGIRQKEKVGGVYKVRRGDSWWRIAQREGVSIKDLKEWNPEIAASDLRAGQRINIGGQEAPRKMEPIETVGSFETSMTTTDSTAKTVALSSSELLTTPGREKSKKEGSKNLNYEVKSGDTLWDIAKKYGISVSKIKEWNNLDSKSHRGLKPGDQLTLLVD